MDRLCYLFLIFFTGCLVGWIYEKIFYWITEGLLRNRSILYGPWLPIYGIDPTPVRLGWVVFCALGGSGILIYIIAAIVIPRRPEC